MHWNQLEGWLVTGGRSSLPPPLHLRHLPRSREQHGESRLHCNLTQTPPAKLLKIRSFPEFQGKLSVIDIGVMLKAFAKVIEDDYIMQSNGLPQL